MKTARRQELKANELAQSLDELREFFRNYGNYVVGGLVVVALLVVGYVYNVRSTQQAQIDATAQMRALPFATDENVRDSVRKLTAIGAEAKDDAVVLESLRRRAQYSIQRAHAAEDGTPSAEFLDLAEAAYREMLDRFGGNPVDRGMALIGLATIEEDRFVLDNDATHKDKVKNYLERVRDNDQLTGTPFQSIALERLNALDRTFIAVAIAGSPVGPPLPPLGQAPVTAPKATAAQTPPADAAQAVAAQTPTTDGTQAATKKQPKKKRRGRFEFKAIDESEVPASFRDALNKNLDALEVEQAQKRKAREAKKKAKKKAKKEAREKAAAAAESKKNDDQDTDASGDEGND